MGCFSCGGSSGYESDPPTRQTNPETKSTREEVLLQIPSCTVHLMDQGEALELCNGGRFTLSTIVDDSVSLVTVIKVGPDLQWPLTKDEPVLKLDSLHYLFSLPVKDGDPLSYGVAFSEQFLNHLEVLDGFLKEQSCFSASPPSKNNNGNRIDWKEFAPKIDDYNSVLARAIAGGTGQIVKGIFKCSNAYSNQVYQGGEMIMTRASSKNNNGGNGIHQSGYSSGSGDDARKKTAVNRSLKRVRKVSKMTEKISKKMLDGVQFATGSVVGPIVKSQAGKSFVAMVPGEVLLASLDAINRVLDAAEAAEKQALSATSKAATRMVSNRFGENAGEATGDVLATAGHCAGTAWNVFKIRKAINPASSVSNGVVKNAAKATRKNSY